MSEQVKVADVETIERFRAQLIQAAETFGLALEEAEGDIERTLAWLESDRPDTWRKQIRKAQDKVRISGDHRGKNGPGAPGGCPAGWPQLRAVVRDWRVVLQPPGPATRATSPG